MKFKKKNVSTSSSSPVENKASESDSKNGIFHVQVPLPKEYAIKFRIMLSCLNINCYTVAREAIIRDVDKIWDENIETIQKTLNTVIK